jgi:acylphosphatase
MSDHATVQRVHVVVSGLVQGVFYRASSEAVARELGLSGWVRNLPDGRVEAIAEGPRPALERFLAWCERGPEHARVDRVEAVWGSASGEFAGFATRR